MAAISMSSWPKLRTAQSEVSATSISPRLPDRAEMQSTHRAGPTRGSDVRDLTRQLLHSGCPEQLQAAMSMLFIQIAFFSHEDDRPVAVNAAFLQRCCNLRPELIAANLAKLPPGRVRVLGSPKNKSCIGNYHVWENRVGEGFKRGGGGVGG